MMNDMMGMPFGGLFLLLIIVAVACFVILINRGISSSGMSDESPLDILKRRYASGEIDKETFDSMKKNIEREDE